jgi:hypothetical protein
MADCKTIQKMIIPFDEGRLSIKEEEMFVNHLENCADCKEEFEIHYIISYGLSDDEDAVSVEPEYKIFLNHYDFKGLVNLKLKNSRIKIKHVRDMNRISLICWLSANICLILTIMVYIIIKYY